MQNTIGEHNGQIVIIGEWSQHWENPVMYRHYWPTGLKVKEYPDFIGQAVRPVYAGNTGLYETIEIIGFRRPMIALIDGNKTKSIFIEEKPIKKPKNKPHYWHGDWHPYPLETI